MARPTDMDVADVVVRALDAFAGGARVLVAGDATGRIADGLGGRAAEWHRRAPGAGGERATPWPAAGPFSSAIVRLPKSRAELEMTLHAVAAVVEPGAPVWLVGANDEGIKSAGAAMERLLGAVTTVDTRRHCRILSAARPREIAGLKARLADWRTTVSLDVGQGARAFATYPGVFAHGRLDEGTALLLAHLPDFAAGARVLDYGCGIGVIAAAVLSREDRAKVVMLDVDAVALEAARENVPAARAVCGAQLADLAAVGPFDVILSNPPIHDGKSESHAALVALIEQAPQQLSHNGVLQIVVQRRVHAGEMMRKTFGACEVVAQNGAFEVLRTRRG